jgi:hypothetical protein
MCRISWFEFIETYAANVGNADENNLPAGA